MAEIKTIRGQMKSGGKGRQGRMSFQNLLMELYNPSKELSVS